ncbi:MAG: signal recognition particle-docking protein FtsY [Ruminococcaceae bacterium]|nr:signal recognition particle-docking protein FtsY [Oscillospiraceae bacterium]
MFKGFKGMFGKKEDNEILQQTNRETEEINGEIVEEDQIEQTIEEDVTEEEVAAESTEISQADAMEETPGATINIGNDESTHMEMDATEATVEKKGFFARLAQGLSKTRDSFNEKVENVLKTFRKVDEELFEELEEALITADVGVETSLYIIDRLRTITKERKISESDEVMAVIKEIITEILCSQENTLTLAGKPAVVLVIGVNGVGKTTSIGKIAARMKAEGKKVILGAGDTFRAAAIDQLQVWADRAGVDLIKHQEGADPAAVVFDTIAAAKARQADVMIFDTAGRLHNKKNLMDELNKIFRVIARELPDSSREVLLVLDATTGQNAVSQAKLFSETADITGIVLTKLDGTAKGGIVIAIAHEQNIPVKFVGVGEGTDDLQEFKAQEFVNALFDA